MLGELALRFAVGGVLVSAFAFLGEAVRPKSFAGLFSAAPSVALASLALSAWSHPRRDLVVSGRSMALGALALVMCTAVCHTLLRRTSWPVPLASLVGWLAWAGVAVLGWRLWLGGVT